MLRSNVKRKKWWSYYEGVPTNDVTPLVFWRVVWPIAYKLAWVSLCPYLTTFVSKTWQFLPYVKHNSAQNKVRVNSALYGRAGTHARTHTRAHAHTFFLMIKSSFNLLLHFLVKNCSLGLQRLAGEWDKSQKLIWFPPLCYALHCTACRAQILTYPHFEQHCPVVRGNMV